MWPLRLPARALRHIACRRPLLNLRRLRIAQHLRGAFPAFLLVGIVITTFRVVVARRVAPRCLSPCRGPGRDHHQRVGRLETDHQILRRILHASADAVRPLFGKVHQDGQRDEHARGIAGDVLWRSTCRDSRLRLIERWSLVLGLDHYADADEPVRVVPVHEKGGGDDELRRRDDPGDVRPAAKDVQLALLGRLRRIPELRPSPCS